MEIISKGIGKVYKIKKGLFKTYDINVVDGFDYTIKQGEIIGILGVEGSGKSTIIKLLSGRDLPTTGEILVDGEIDYKTLRYNCEIISDFKTRSLLKNESVYNNFLHFGSKYKVDSLDVEKNISSFRDVFELGDIINKKISELNELELIKVNITISMLKSSPILFFDESLSGLNVIERNIVLKMLKRLNKEYKTTIVVSSNSLTDIEKICKRITLIKNGKIIRDGSFEKVKKEFFSNKEIRIVFNKSFNAPKGDFQILEQSDYFIRIKIDFEKFGFASLINQFDVMAISDITISNVSLAEL
jgi:ABC-2 type transport system ATP-binding protein